MDRPLAGVQTAYGKTSCARSPGRTTDDVRSCLTVAREIITTPDAPSSPLYAQAVKAGGQIFVSGTVGIDPTSGDLAGEAIQDQTRQALKNCEAILQAAGATLDDVVEVGVLLHDPADFAGFNEEWARWFPSDPPARHAAKLGAVIPRVLVSIRMTAVVD